MSLFIVAGRNKRTGKEYLVSQDGYDELSHAREAMQREIDRDFLLPEIELYVGRVVSLDTPVGGERTLADLS